MSLSGNVPRVNESMICKATSMPCPAWICELSIAASHAASVLALSTATGTGTEIFKRPILPGQPHNQSALLLYPSYRTTFDSTWGGVNLHRIVKLRKEFTNE
jgi:hypothetical protein